MAGVLIGVDAGTTNIKTVAFSPEGDELARASRGNEVLADDGRTEQDMVATWERAAETIREVVRSLPADDDVGGVGVTGQGDGCWLVDGDGKPARDAILWNDGRAAGIVEEWGETGVSDRIFDICGNGLFAGASLPILRWLHDHEPATLEHAETVVFCKDWIKYRLTGELTTDLSDASLPYLDIRAGAYTDELSALAGVPDVEDLFPRLEPATEVIGTVTDPASERTGLPAGTPVISGVIDIVASAVGSGAARPGDSSSVVGTTALNQTILKTVPDLDEPVGFTLAIDEDRYTRAMASMAGTPNLDWARAEIAETDDFDAVERAARSVPAGADGLLYHPYLSSSGERSPFVDSAARAGFTGLDPSHTRAHLLRAVYEGVALAMRDCYEHLPTEADRVVVSGGGAGSAFWCQLFADCLDTTVVVPEGSELGARGIALLVGVTLDEFVDVAAGLEAMTGIDRSYEPRPAYVRRYDRWYDVYRTTYEAMFDAWEKRAAVVDRMDADGR
jgi:sugar (pentulose or hexulose) kinase